MTDDTPLFPVLRGRHIFPAHFIVRDEHLAAIDIIAEIPEMHEERHDIVRRGERRHIILEGRRVYGNRRSGHHAHDCIAQAGLVEVDVDLERLIRLGTVPVRIIPMRQHRLDDAFRAVNMRRLWETVPIVPGAALGKIHVILRAQLTSSSVNPTKEAKLRGFSIEYSVNILSAECVPYFLMGKMPVI